MARYAPYIRFDCGCRSSKPCRRGARLFYGKPQDKHVERRAPDHAKLLEHLDSKARIVRPSRAA